MRLRNDLAQKMDWFAVLSFRAAHDVYQSDTAPRSLEGYVSKDRRESASCNSPHENENGFARKV
jgi:hypothetical protein